MSYNQIIKNQLVALKLNGAFNAFEQQVNDHNYLELDFYSRLSEILQAEIDYKKRQKT